MVVFRQKLLHSGKVVLIGKIGCFRVKVVVFGVERLYSGKKMLYLDKGGCIRAKFLFSS